MQAENSLNQKKTLDIASDETLGNTVKYYSKETPENDYEHTFDDIVEETSKEAFEEAFEEAVGETFEETFIDFIIFQTERLFIREFNQDDVDAVYAYAGDSENTVFMEWGPESYEDVRNFIYSRLKHQISCPRTSYDFAVCLKETGELIGGMGLYLDDKRMQGELGYIFNKKFWGMGYATEAANGFLRFGFMTLDLHRIHAKCDSENFASENVMKRIGMRKEGETKSSVYTCVRRREQWRGEKLYAMLQKEYLLKLCNSKI